MLAWNKFLSPHGLAGSEVIHRSKRRRFRIYHSLPEEELWRVVRAVVVRRYPNVDVVSREAKIEQLLDAAEYRAVPHASPSPG